VYTISPFYPQLTDSNDSNELEKEIVNEDEDKRDDDNDDVILLEGYMFPGFMAVMVWGPLQIQVIGYQFLMLEMHVNQL
jgi:hypothetical protein